MLTTGFFEPQPSMYYQLFRPLGRSHRAAAFNSKQQLVILIQISVVGFFIVVLGFFFQFYTYMYGPGHNILRPLDTFKRAQLKISLLFLNQYICCHGYGYSKNYLIDTVRLSTQHMFISLPKHMLWILKRTISKKWFF